jgi:hypothetical protein
MGTGVGEMMLMSAAVGGGSAALTGGDPLKGALLGGLTGGLGAGISGALSAAAPATIATTVAPEAALAANTAANAGTGLTAGANAANLATNVGNSVLPTVTNTANAANVANAASGAAPFSANGFPALGGNPAIASSVAAPEVAVRSLSGTAPGITTLPNGLPTTISDKILISPALNPSAVAQNVITPNAVPSAPMLNAADVGNFYPPNYSLAKPVVGELGPVNYSLAKNPIAPAVDAAAPTTGGSFTEGMQKFLKDPMASIKANPLTAASSAYQGATGARKKKEEEEEYAGPLSRFRYNPDSYSPMFAEGGIAALASGGYDQMVGEEPMYPSNMAHGGIANLGSYSDGGRMLRGPGDGMSDSIPASISGKRPARLADGEFVVPADVVSHLGNGSTDAGAKQLYAMMNKVRKARTGRKAQGREINPRQYVPA